MYKGIHPILDMLKEKDIPVSITLKGNTLIMVEHTSRECISYQSPDDFMGFIMRDGEKFFAYCATCNNVFKAH